VKTGTLGRNRVLPDDFVRRLRTLTEAGIGSTQIARALNDANVPTAHGGAQWWPATIRKLARRTLPEDLTKDEAARAGS
jgi:hypothetical protein